MWSNPGIFNLLVLWDIKLWKFYVSLREQWLPVAPDIRTPPGTGSQYHIIIRVQFRYLQLRH